LLGAIFGCLVPEVLSDMVFGEETGDAVDLTGCVRQRQETVEEPAVDHRANGEG
jgi:hypothetical protein